MRRTANFMALAVLSFILTAPFIAFLWGLGAGAGDMAHQTLETPQVKPQPIQKATTKELLLKLDIQTKQLVREVKRIKEIKK